MITHTREKKRKEFHMVTRSAYVLNSLSASSPL